MSRRFSASDSWRELDDASYTELRRELLRKKGSEVQRDFLESLKGSSAFASLIRGRVQFTEGDDPPVLQTQLTESEFVKPPANTEQNFYRTWHDTTPAQASRTTFWGNVMLQNIEAGIIEPCFLISSGTSSVGAMGRIYDVLKAGNEKQIDDLVRRCLRQFSGLPERGARSVYVNCPLAKAWWRCYLAHEICDCSKATFKDIHQVLRRSQEYWERLIVLVVSRNSIVGDSKIRSALVWALSELDDSKAPSDAFVVKGLERIGRAIGIRLAWQELGVLSVPQIKDVMHKEIIPITR